MDHRKYLPSALVVRFLCALLFSAAALLAGAPAALAQQKVIKVGTLKLIIGMTPFLYEKFAPPGYRFEVTLFDTPADVSAAVATRSVDVGMVGYPVAVLAFSNGQPITVIGASTDGGFGIVAAVKSDIKSIADLKGIHRRDAVPPAHARGRPRSDGCTGRAADVPGHGRCARPR